MQEVNRYSSGQEFGDLALQGAGVRQVTVVATKNTKFIVLNKEAYDKIIGQEKNRKNSLINIVKELYYFDNTHRKILQSFIVNKELEIFRFGQKIFDWGKKLDKLYVVMEGSVTLIRTRPVVKKDEEKKTLANFLLEGNIEDFEDLIQKDIGLPMPKEPFKLIEEISIREVGQPFGEEFVTFGVPANYKAVSSSQKTVVATITEDTLKKKLFQFMPSCRLEFEGLINERIRLGYKWKKKNINAIMNRQKSSNSLEQISSSKIEEISEKKGASLSRNPNSKLISSSQNFSHTNPRSKNSSFNLIRRGCLLQ